MISEDLANATRELWKNVGSDPGGVWAPWTTVSHNVGASMISYLEVLLTQAFLRNQFENILKPIRIRQPQHYEELARLTAVAPWSELLMLTEDGMFFTINKNLTDDDIAQLFKIHSEHSSATADFFD